MTAPGPGLTSSRRTAWRASKSASVTWLARWRDPEGRQRKRTFPRKADAGRFLTTVEHSVLTGSYVDGRSRVRVGDWSVQWLDGQVQLTPSTRARYASVLRRQVLPCWGSVPLARVSTRGFCGLGGRAQRIGVESAHRAQGRIGSCRSYEALAAACAGRGPDELVFIGPAGGRWVLRNNNWRRRAFDSAAIRVGLEGLMRHELRHTAASLAVSAGANVKAVQRMLGQASAAMTLDVYRGLFGDDLDVVAERLDALTAEIVVPPVRPEPSVVALRDRREGS